jgi:hypothetical protein
MRRLGAALRLAPAARILDVGGRAETWQHESAPTGQVIVSNVRFKPWEHRDVLRFGSTAIRASGLLLPFRDRSFDLLFSNSVIEHVGTFEDQQHFAAEVRRVGRALWVQTPAFESPFESHWIGLGVHWAPRAWQPHLVAWLTVHGWVNWWDRAAAEANLANVRLLTKREMQRLFPDCEIWTERILGVPKSYVAIRDAQPAGRPRPDS